MKKLLGTVLILSMLGGSAAVAAPRDFGGHGFSRGYGHGGGNGALAAGVGFLAALAAIIASQSHHPAGYYDQGDYRAAPPPPPAYGYDGRYDAPYDNRGESYDEGGR